MKSLILFSNDLRLDDNEAICASVKKYHSSTFAFVYDEELYKNTHGSANLWWLENSLKSLKNRLKEKNISLHIMKGEYVSKILEIVKDNNFKAVFLNQNKHPNFIVKEKKLDKELSKIDVKFYSFNNTNLSEPDRFVLLKL
jgi:deoxyribodipyrimidine photolyase